MIPPTIFSLLNYNPLHTWFVTLTYKDSVNNFKSWIKDMPNIVSSLTKCGEFKLTAEIDDSGRFHWHYIIKCSDKIKHLIFLNQWQRKYGFIKSKPVVDLMGTFIYIRKQSYEMCKVISEHLNVPENSALAIITNSTAPLVVIMLQGYLKERVSNTKKYNELQTTLTKMKGTIFEYF